MWVLDAVSICVTHSHLCDYLLPFQVVGFVCGTCTSAPTLTHESMSKHDPKVSNGYPLPSDYVVPRVFYLRPRLRFAAQALCSTITLRCVPPLLTQMG